MNERVDAVLLSGDMMKVKVLNFQENEILTFDSWFKIGLQLPSYEGKFYSFKSKDDLDVLGEVYGNKIFYRLREVYGVLDIIGELGGVTGIFTSLIGFFVSPIAYHSFLIKAISLLYKVETKEKKLFLDKKGATKKESSARFYNNKENLP